MATWNASSPTASPCSSSRRRTKAPPRRPSSESPPPRKMKSMAEIMAKSVLVLEEEEQEEDEDSYGDVTCEKCGSGEGDDELLLCDKCDRGFHMKCLRPIVVRVPIGPWLCVDCSDQRPVRRLSQKKILHFFRIEKHTDRTDKSELSQEETRKHRRRSCSLTVKKRRRKLLPLVPSEDPDQRLKQMGTLATALTALGIKYSDGLTYVPGMAPRSANQSKFEKGGMQVLSKEDLETLEQCQAMGRRGECPPLVVVFDPLEGYTVEADGPIKDLTFIAEYTGDVDYLKNREKDDCDSIMTLLLSEDPSKTLVICPDKYGNISRFINGINNHNPFGKKKQNCKCVRYSIKGECRVLIVATRDISKGERLYYDYNGYEHESIRNVELNCMAIEEGSLAAARQAAGFVRGDDVLHKIFTELAYRYKDRAGGYTRMLRTRIRVGDAAPMAYIEFIDRENELRQSKPATPQPQQRVPLDPWARSRLTRQFAPPKEEKTSDSEL